MQGQQGAPNAATTAFQLAIPHVLQQVSPALASLHASRFRLLHHPDASSEALIDSHCTKCGTFLYDGSGTIRTVRPKRRRPKSGATNGSTVQMLRKSCGACGHYRDSDISLEESNAILFQRTAKRQKQSLTSDNRTLPSMSTTPIIAAPEPKVAPVQHMPEVPIPPKLLKPSSSPAPSAYQPQLRAGAPSTSGNPSRVEAKKKKKKGGLQEILARNRERQEQEKNKQASSGLSAFLEGL